jgi:hypothetical protein
VASFHWLCHRTGLDFQQPGLIRQTTPAALALLAPTGLVCLFPSFHGGAFLGWRVPIASKAVGALGPSRRRRLWWPGALSRMDLSIASQAHAHTSIWCSYVGQVHSRSASALPRRRFEPELAPIHSRGGLSTCPRPQRLGFRSCDSLSRTGELDAGGVFGGGKYSTHPVSWASTHQSRVRRPQHRHSQSRRQAQCSWLPALPLAPASQRLRRRAQGIQDLRRV